MRVIETIGIELDGPQTACAPLFAIPFEKSFSIPEVNFSAPLPRELPEKMSSTFPIDARIL